MQFSLLGCTGIRTKLRSDILCSDPRILMMYLWKTHQKCFKLPVTDPPIPTREEAIKWLKKMDIPIGPQEYAREPTPKLKRNFLNIKE